MSGNFLLIYICNVHVLSDVLLIYICKLHWNLNMMLGQYTSYPLDMSIFSFTGADMKFVSTNRIIQSMSYQVTSRTINLNLTTSTLSQSLTRYCDFHYRALVINGYMDMMFMRYKLFLILTRKCHNLTRIFTPGHRLVRSG